MFFSKYSTVTTEGLILQSLHFLSIYLWLFFPSLVFISVYPSSIHHLQQPYWENHAGWLSVPFQLEHQIERKVCARFSVSQYSFYLGNQQI